MSRTIRTAALTAATIGVAHAAPALAAIGPLRRRWLPTLAGTGDPGHIALTFDDGPHPDATPAFLKLLDNAGVRATFFLLGHELENNPQLGRALIAAGHEVGVHGYEHRLLLNRGPRATRDDLTRATTAVTDITGIAPRWWRPPYGVATTTALLAARRLGLTPVLWTCWGRDWTPTATPDRIFRSVRHRIAGGATILLHDSDHYAAPRSWEATLAALPAILTLCQARGLEIGPLGEHRCAPTQTATPRLTHRSGQAPTRFAAPSRRPAG